MVALRHEREIISAEKDSESESLANLQNVLEEFESGNKKKSELNRSF